MSRLSGPSFQFICRQCRLALHTRPASGRRRFTSSRQLDSRALPAFQPTSSPELDNLLSTIRLKYFLPQYLNPKQRELIRSDKLRSQLENDPVYATFGEEEIRLEHIDVTKDMPRRKAFHEVIDMLQNKKDWAVLPGLLEGYHGSKVKLPPHWFAKMIRKACEADAMGIVTQCLTQVERNGFSLGIPEVREQILLAIRRSAKESGWDQPESLRRVEMILQYMEHPEHCGSRKVDLRDPRAEPYVMAVPLELAAHAVLNGAKERTGKVETYSTRLITALAQQQTELNDEAAWKITEDPEKPYWTPSMLKKLDLLVAKYTVVYHALKLAQQVRGQSWPQEESAYASIIQKQIAKRLDGAVQEAARFDPSALEVAMPGINEWKENAGQ